MTTNHKILLPFIAAASLTGAVASVHAEGYLNKNLATKVYDNEVESVFGVNLATKVYDNEVESVFGVNLATKVYDNEVENFVSGGSLPPIYKGEAKEPDQTLSEIMDTLLELKDM